MDLTGKERSTERPPSPTAPRGARFRHRRTRVATGAAVISLALATALGPAAADELMADEASATETARTETPAPSRNPVSGDQDLAKAPKEPSERDKQVLVLTLIKQQRDAEAVFARLAAHEAAEAERQREAEEAAEAERQREAERESDSGSGSDEGGSPAPAPEAAPSGGGGVWDRLAQCESGGDWSINTGNGYYGGLQFSLSTWQAMGGTGMPHENSRSAQIAVAERTLAAQGWGAWPSCSSKLGLR